MKFKRNWRSLLPYQTQLTYKSLSKRNEIFQALPLADQRKEISLDVLELLSTRRIIGEKGAYWGEKLNYIKRNSSGSKDFQKSLFDTRNMDSCEVCARGAAQLSTIRLGNNISPNDCGAEEGTHSNLRYFTIQEYKSMERVFENWDVFGGRIHRREYPDYPYGAGTNYTIANIQLQIIITGMFEESDVTDYLELILS